MKKSCYLLFLPVLFYLLQGCSSNRNTSVQRFRYGFMTQYNIYYNAKNTFNTALQKQLSSSGKDSIETEKLLNEVILKCQKGIELYSIREKPAKKRGWQKNPKQRELRNRTEYNPFIGHCWLLMGKAYYYNRKYEEAFQTFSYLTQHFKEKENITREAFLWETKTLDKLQENYLTENPTSYDRTLSLSASLLSSSIKFSSSQDSVYNLVYNYWYQHKYTNVRKLCTQFYKEHPNDPLTPSFLYIEALSHGREKEHTHFRLKLQELVEKYPHSPQAGSAGIWLKQMEERKIITEENIPLHASYPVSKSSLSPVGTLPFRPSFIETIEQGSPIFYVLIISLPEKKPDEEILFEIATFHFHTLLQKQLDIQIRRFGKERTLLLSAFKDIQEIRRYYEIIKANPPITELTPQSHFIYISDTNYRMLRTAEHLKAYLEFYFTEELPTLPRNLNR